MNTDIMVETCREKQKIEFAYKCWKSHMRRWRYIL